MIKIGIIDLDKNYSNKIIEYLDRFNNIKIDFFFNGKYNNHNKIIINKKVNILILDIVSVTLGDIEYFQNLLPQTKIIVVARMPNQNEVLATIRLGVASFIMKTNNPHDLHETILTVFTGGKVLGSSAASLVMDYLSLDNKKSDWDILTTREQDFANEMLNGLTYQEIADNLFVSTSTVNFHLQKIYSKLEVKSRTGFLSKYLGKQLTVDY